MVILFSYANPLLLLFSTALVVIHGYRHNSLDEETTLLGYRLDDDLDFHMKRDPGKNLMWIGPRLGRRKRSDDENVENAPLPEKNGGTVVEFLQDSPWAFVALKGGKRRTVNFIPRLGRDSEEEYDSSMDSSFGKSSSRSGNQLAVPFGGGNNFTPRLGSHQQEEDNCGTTKLATTLSHVPTVRLKKLFSPRGAGILNICRFNPSSEKKRLNESSQSQAPGLKINGMKTAVLTNTKEIEMKQTESLIYATKPCIWNTISVYDKTKENSEYTKYSFEKNTRL